MRQHPSLLATRCCPKSHGHSEQDAQVKAAQKEARKHAHKHTHIHGGLQCPALITYKYLRDLTSTQAPTRVLACVHMWVADVPHVSRSWKKSAQKSDKRLTSGPKTRTKYIKYHITIISFISFISSVSYNLYNYLIDLSLISYWSLMMFWCGEWSPWTGHGLGAFAVHLSAAPAEPGTVLITRGVSHLMIFIWSGETLMLVRLINFDDFSTPNISVCWGGFSTSNTIHQVINIKSPSKIIRHDPIDQ